MNIKPQWVIFFGLLVTACGNIDNTVIEAAEAQCDELVGLSIPPESIGLPTSGATVSEAVFQYTPTVAYCRLLGAIASTDQNDALSINFQVNLPANWNKKALHYGSSDSYNGRLVTGLDYVESSPMVSKPIARGYATWGSDGGNQLSDGSFLLDDEALRNFGGDQLKKTHDVAMFAVNKFYGQNAESVYIQGSGPGGREALVAAQRWPENYDGVIAINPITSLVGMYVGSVLAEQALAQPSSRMDPSDLALLSASVVDACDDLDGNQDGIISNPTECATAFDISILRCADTFSNRDQCLEDAQIAVMETIARGFEISASRDGVQPIASWPVFSGIDLTEHFNEQSPYFNPVKEAAPFIRFGLLGGSDINSQFTQNGRELRIEELSNLVDVSTDLTEFANRGGKTIVLHGASNFDIPYDNTQAWYENVVSNSGQQLADSFLRYWLIPGFDSETNSPEFQWRTLEALEAWAERQIPPTI